MTNIDDFDPKLLLINEIRTCKSGSTMFEINYCEENNTPYVVFNKIECIFRKSGIYSYLVFCETKENEKILKKYTEIIDKIKDQILFITEDVSFTMDKDFMRSKFKTNDNLPYNIKLDVAVCVILLNSAFEQGWYYPQLELQDCFDED